MKARTLILTALALALTVIGVVVALLLRAPIAKGKRAAREAEPTKGATERPALAEGASALHDEPTKARAAETPSASRIDRKQADELRDRLHALFADAGLAWGSPNVEVDAGRPGEVRMMPGPGSDGGDDALKKYIQTRMRDDFFPMAKDCYTGALAKTPTLKGTFILEYRIVGDTRVGGVVDTTAAGEGSTINDPTFTECMTQSMMSVSFDAPPEGTKELTVAYPIAFSPDDEEDGGS